MGDRSMLRARGLAVLLWPVLIASECVISDCGQPPPSCADGECAPEEELICLDQCYVPAELGDKCGTDPCSG